MVRKVHGNMRKKTKKIKTLPGNGEPSQREKTNREKNANRDSGSYYDFVRSSNNYSGFKATPNGKNPHSRIKRGKRSEAKNSKYSKSSKAINSMKHPFNHYRGKMKSTKYVDKNIGENGIGNYKSTSKKKKNLKNKSKVGRKVNSNHKNSNKKAKESKRKKAPTYKELSNSRAIRTKLCKSNLPIRMKRSTPMVERPSRVEGIKDSSLSYSERPGYLTHRPKSPKLVSKALRNKVAQTQTSFHKEEEKKVEEQQQVPEKNEDNEASITYDQNSEFSPRKSAPTAYDDALDTHQKNLLNYLLDERKKFISQVEDQSKMIQSFKEEIRKVKTLSHYYPDNRDLIIEEGEGMRDSMEEDEEPQRNDVFIASSSDVFNYDKANAGIIALRGSYDQLSSRDNPLRRSGNGYRPLSDDGNGLRVNSQGQSPRGKDPNFLRSIGIDMEPEMSADPLRSSSNGIKNLRSSTSANPLRDSLRGDLVNDSFEAPKDILRGDAASIRSSIRSQKSYKFEIPGDADEDFKEIPKLLENFIRYLTDKRDEETLKFAEFTFSKIRSIFENQQSRLKDTRSKNFSLVSIIADLKEKERLNMIKNVSEGRLGGFGRTVTNHISCDRDNQSTLFGGSLMIPRDNDDWETLDMKSPDYNPDAEAENKNLTIPINLQKFDQNIQRMDILNSISSEREQKPPLAPLQDNSLLSKMNKKRSMAREETPITIPPPQQALPSQIPAGNNIQYFNVSISNNCPAPLVINTTPFNQSNPQNQQLPLSNNFSYFFMSRNENTQNSNVTLKIKLNLARKYSRPGKRAARGYSTRVKCRVNQGN